MAIKSICKTNVVTIDKKSTLLNVSNVMQKNHVGSVVVTEGMNGKKIPAGMITDRDIALAVGSSPRPQELRVENIMQSAPITVKVSEGIFETIVKMRESGVKRIPVINEDGTLYGIVCADDLLELMSEEMNNLAKINETQINKEKGITLPTKKGIKI
ncbi:MAG: CBS domain-containing protein [Bdellovibrio sp.]|nr:CBS domain-containing protein [Bdellovibrio sp.]